MMRTLSENAPPPNLRGAFVYAGYLSMLILILDLDALECQRKPRHSRPCRSLFEAALLKGHSVFNKLIDSGGNGTDCRRHILLKPFYGSGLVIGRVLIAASTTFCRTVSLTVPAWHSRPTGAVRGCSVIQWLCGSVVSVNSVKLRSVSATDRNLGKTEDAAAFFASCTGFHNTPENKVFLYAHINALRDDGFVS